MQRFGWIFAAILGIGFWGCDGDQSSDVEALKQRFHNAENSLSDRMAAGRLLLDNDEGKAFVVAQYWTAHQNVVQQMIKMLTRSDPMPAASLLAALMARADGEEKVHFEAQLIALGSAAVPALIALSEAEIDWQTAMQVLDALGKLKAHEGVTVIQRYLAHENDWVRIASAHALGDLGGHDVVDPLVGALKDTSETVVAAALIGLGKAGDRRAVNPCAGLLSHSNPRLRSAAVSAISRLGGVNARRLLEPMLKDDDSGVRYKADRALKGLK